MRDLETNTKNYTTFFKRAEFFLAGKKARDEDCGRILLGDDTGAAKVMLRPIRFRCIAVVYAYMHNWPCTYWVPNCAGLPDRNYALSLTILVPQKLHGNSYLCKARSLSLFLSLSLSSERHPNPVSGVHMSVHRQYISKIQPTRCNVFSIYLFL